MNDGEVASFEAFYAAVVPSLRRLAFARTGSWETSEDLVQDAMADAHRRWGVISRYTSPEAWARRAVLNRSISTHRRRGRERRALERLAHRPIPPVAYSSQLEDELLWSAVRALSPRQMGVVLLLWFEDLPVSEVADTLGCSEATVRTHWRRARTRLSELLGEADRPIAALAATDRPDFQKEADR